MNWLICASLIVLLLAAMSPTSLKAETFDVLFTTEKKLDSGEKVKIVLMEGGIADGIDVGMQGELWAFPSKRRRRESKDSVHVGYVTIEDAVIHESAAVVTLTGNGKLKKGLKVVIDTPALSADDFLDKGRSALTLGQCDLAVFCYDTAMSLADDTRKAALLEEVRSCIMDLRKESVRIIQNQGWSGQGDQLPPYLLLALLYQEKGKAEQYETYFNKLFAGVYQEYGDSEFLNSIIDKSDEGYQRPPDVPDTGDVYPEMTYKYVPSYPWSAKLDGISGTVWVKALVGKNGQVLIALLSESSGSVWLDHAAVASAYKCPFQPGFQDGKPVLVWVTWKVEFVLH